MMRPPFDRAERHPVIAPAPAESRIAVFVSGLDDIPSGRAAVALANALHRRGHGLDIVAPMGGGPLRTALLPGIGQIDLAKRHTATSVLALARIVAERRPAGLIGSGADAGLVALAAARLSRCGTPVAVLEDAPSPSEQRLRRFLLSRLQPCAAVPLSSVNVDPEEATRIVLTVFGLPDVA